MINYIEAPRVCNAPANGTASVFLAGGITGCPDWQSAAVDMLEQLDAPVTVLNPRRDDFPIHDPDAAEAQIRWEYHHLHRADIIAFWFPDSGPITQPIALYELGRYAALQGLNDALLVVGRDHRYVRRQDVDIQLRLARPDLTVYTSLADVCERVAATARWLTQAPSEPAPA